MKYIYRLMLLTARLWIIPSLYLGLAFVIWLLYSGSAGEYLPALAAVPVSLILTLPVAAVLFFTLLLLGRRSVRTSGKPRIILWVCMICGAGYGLAGGMIFASSETWHNTNLYYLYASGCMLVVCTCACMGWFHTRKSLNAFFSDKHHRYLSNSNNYTMETTKTTLPEGYPASSASGNIVVKAVITGVLILVMLIPTLFIAGLVSEREQRQQEVAAEVSGKWASAQTLTGPYLYIPYLTRTTSRDGKTEESKKHYWLLPDELKMTGNITHEIRPRSIYKVLLYKASLENAGSFKIEIPDDITSHDIIWKDIKICYGLSDFRGIEERFTIRFNGASYELTPGLPSGEISRTGLYANVRMTPEQNEQVINYALSLKLKGSEKLHFIPMSGNSSFQISSDWNSPSFDGSNLPGERTVSDSGFQANWAFNKSNLPFGTLLRDFSLEKEDLAFGVTLVQPAGQYAKANRSIKYAILIIGLTFSLFFIVELLQKKPVHPVQYVLIGLALVIFYTLLLSISEFIAFNTAYIIAAVSTLSLITAYAWMHFKRIQSAALFAALLSILYGFIFVLIQLEDTALLVGSIGLFIVLALVMFASRKVNWYGHPDHKLYPAVE